MVHPQNGVLGSCEKEWKRTENYYGMISRICCEIGKIKYIRGMLSSV